MTSKAIEDFKITSFKITLKKDGLPRCSTKTTPGVITQRSCVYYGARWILAPIKNTIHVVHGPVGCAYYGAYVRKKNYMVVSSDANEVDIIYGGEEKLFNTIIESAKELKGDVIFVYVTCPTALNGDDVEGVCRRAEKTLKIPVIPVYCPGFCGYHQSKGHEIGMMALFRLIDKEPLDEKTDDIINEKYEERKKTIVRLATRLKKNHKIKNYPLRYNHIKKVEKSHNNKEDYKYAVNIIGEFDVADDLKVIKDLLSKLGIKVICTFTGDCDVKNIMESKKAKLNLIHCRATGKHIANYMEEKYGIPQLKVSFFGITNTQKSLLDIGKFFGIEDKVVRLINEEYKRIEKELNYYLEKLENKRVGIFMGGSKIGMLSSAFRDMGMDVVVVGSQFGSLEDYLEAYMNVDEDTVLIDDASNIDLQLLMENKRPDIFVGGTKEKFLSLKVGIPFISFPQDDYPFTGFVGFLNFAKEVYRNIYHPIWKMIEFNMGCFLK
ncbi:nitrogenase component 1 [Methanotorris formicicus]|uniref:Nitrogenase n=1 Tax=Methanotorris formicicus Mc-S-70 TaxID=647171 RepID=H1KWK7_9EURY|nr:nitrogenase component 1 [Methanotorris formicicus]EHP89122.1 Nitrogenase [Methanotorris formicicus Mc-S-70]